MSFNIYTIKDSKSKTIYIGISERSPELYLTHKILPLKYDKKNLKVKKLTSFDDKDDAKLELEYLIHDYKERGEAIENGKPGKPRPYSKYESLEFTDSWISKLIKKFTLRN